LRTLWPSPLQREHRWTLSGTSRAPTKAARRARCSPAVRRAVWGRPRAFFDCSHVCRAVCHLLAVEYVAFGHPAWASVATLCALRFSFPTLPTLPSAFPRSPRGPRTTHGRRVAGFNPQELPPLHYSNCNMQPHGPCHHAPIAAVSPALQIRISLRTHPLSAIGVYTFFIVSHSFIQNFQNDTLYQTSQPYKPVQNSGSIAGQWILFYASGYQF
jgi:hypothetical protein